ncbi:MAG TPA: SUKH-3 domain-containing protein [Abditibacterium sp.]|jgi:hypothetical protein
MIVLPPDILPLFVEAGWHEERKVALPNWVTDYVPAGHPAREVLSRFGGLKVGESGPGQDHAKSVVNFSPEEYEPGGDRSHITIWNGLLETQLFCVALYGRDYMELYVATDGRYFSASIVDDDFSFMGDSFVEAMHRCVFGKHSRPMLRPDQDSLMYFGTGIKYTRDSPQIYKYE